MSTRRRIPNGDGLIKVHRSKPAPYGAGFSIAIVPHAHEGDYSRFYLEADYATVEQFKAAVDCALALFGYTLGWYVPNLDVDLAAHNRKIAASRGSNRYNEALLLVWQRDRARSELGEVCNALADAEYRAGPPGAACRCTGRENTSHAHADQEGAGVPTLRNVLADAPLKWYNENGHIYVSVPGAPISADGDSWGAALDGLTVAVAEYADAWFQDLHRYDNHSKAWPLAYLVQTFDRLRGSGRGVMSPES